MRRQTTPLVEWIFKTMTLEDVTALYEDLNGGDGELFGIIVARIFKDYDVENIIEAIHNSPYELDSDVEELYS